MKRNSYKINKAGSLGNLKLVEEELPEPSTNEVTVEVKAIGFNFADLFAIQGLYSATPKGSFIPGLEYSGMIIKKGKDVTGFELNEKVMGVIKFGAYTTHLNIDYSYIQKLPGDWSFEEGAAFIVQSLTAYYALVEMGSIKDNYTVLIHSAAGGVGIYANRIAKKFNAYTIGTVGNSSKIDFLKKEGYNDVIVRDKYFKEKLKKTLNGKDLNIVLECIGGEIFKDSFDLLSPNGRIMIYGGAQFMSHSSRPNYLKLLYQYLTRPKIDPLSLSDTNRSVMGFNLIYLWDKPEEMERMLTNILGLNLKTPYVGSTFPFEKLTDGLKLFQSGKTIGKVVVTI
ncbi:quinone oxidoreductase 1 [bacterium BMS3Abin03]|nr:quinone oxidoreductase 1 [bacterium BMS3Abin03]